MHAYMGMSYVHFSPSTKRIIFRPATKTFLQRLRRHGRPLRREKEIPIRTAGAGSEAYLAVLDGILLRHTLLISSRLEGKQKKGK